MKKFRQGKNHDSGVCNAKFAPLDQKLNTLERLFSFPCEVSKKQVYSVTNPPNRITPETYVVDKDKKNVDAKGSKNLSKLKRSFEKVLTAKTMELIPTAKNRKNAKLPIVSIAIDGNDIQIFFEWKRSSTTFSRQWVNFKEVPRNGMYEIRADFSDFILSKVKIHNCFLESAILDMYETKNLVDYEEEKYGDEDEKSKPKILKQVLPNNRNSLVALLPLIIDILLYSRSKTNHKLPFTVGNRGKEQYFILAFNSVQELIGTKTNRNGQLAFRKELEYLHEPTFLTEKQYVGRDLIYYKNGLFLPVQAISQEDKKRKSSCFPDSEYEDFLPLKKYVFILPEWLMKIRSDRDDKKFDYAEIPNLRELFGRYSYLSVNERKAIIWAFLQSIKEHYTPRNTDKLYKVWGIDDDKSHPSRVLKRQLSCLTILLRTGLIYGYRFTVSKSGKEQIVFNMNPFLSRQYIDFSKRETEDYEADEEVDEEDDY